MVSAYAECASAAARSGWVSLAPFGVLTVTDYGADISGAMDSSAAFQRAINAAVSLVGGGGSVIVYAPAGVYKWSAGIVSIPPNIVGKVRVQFAPNSVVNLTSTAFRMFDYVPTANYQTCQNITLDGGGGPYGVNGTTVDAGGFGDSSAFGVGQDQHVIFGTGRPTSFPIQSWANVTVRGFIGTNLPAGGPTVNRSWVNPSLYAASNTTLQTSTNMLFEDMNLTGGVGGIAHTADAPLGAGDWSNCYIDKLICRRVIHENGYTHTAFNQGANFIFGWRCKIGRITVQDCYGSNSGDVGLEIDQAEYALVERCRFENSWTVGVYMTSFSPVNSTDRWVLNDCVVANTATTYPQGTYWGFGGRGYMIDHQNTYYAAPHVELNGCSYFRSTGHCDIDGEAFMAALKAGTTTQVALNNFRAVVNGITCPEAGSNTQSLVAAVARDGTGTANLSLRIRNLHTEYTGSYTGSGTPKISHVSIPLIGAGAMVTDIDIDGWDMLSNITSLVEYQHLVSCRAYSTRVSLRNVHALTGQGGSGPTALMYMLPTSSATCRGIDIDNIDLRNISSWVVARLDDTSQNGFFNVRKVHGLSSVVVKSSNYSVNALINEIVLCTNVTITLPSALLVANDRVYTVRNTHASLAATIATVAGNVDGSSTQSLAAGTAKRYVSDGTNWFSM